ncbi:sodium:solute symporter [Arthrobacter sp. TES]|jgi:SSS family solute:Na+ symporter|uniref:Sodium:solute symporter n=1 Tax=Paenarthrobacter ureafaciens TaxID=37931 RepID=A0AAX3ELG8_PAEUR|nr:MULTISPECIES: sodium:solute symporter [Paenarthrobacter]AMB39584.1 sodium:solute symporter [Arthrobacter sp. ATCC 21022]AOY72464.1 sodium:solute symporter [Arthrobacter sp. ZXY-2]ERI37379.1 sodium:solute symporter [Arthrobacter sp. AK-YN10]NKR12552.1 sodium:solute symporter [Arthrobacter sp. M5]NKR17083.1 sodium:solute symporter [Arthrobacter sp. M6]OEH61205.1 sodium:solute symporter [Arthrobacter sp. D4]OEH61706.1 sodium:solute symporter [Arthrobacter sp. D2]QOI64130.1 sodium:solute sym
MDSSFINIAIVVVYLLAMLAFGWWGKSRTKNNSDFLVAGRRLGPFLYTGTMAAVVLGGASTVGGVGLGYKFGISGMWLVVAIGAGVLLLSLLFAGTIQKLKIYTVSQMLTLRYGSRATQTSGIVMLAYTLMLCATSTGAYATIFVVLFGWERWLAIAIGGAIVLVYSTIGGMWSITLADQVQFVIKTVGIFFLMLPFAMNAAGGLDGIRERVDASFFDIGGIGLQTIITYFVVYTLGLLIGQDIWQRVFTAKTPKVARWGGATAGVYCIVYGLAGALIGMAASVALSGIEIEAKDDVYAEVATNLLPIGIGGLVLAAAVAAMMSTASGALIAAATVARADVLPFVAGWFGKTINTDDSDNPEHDVKANRYWVLGLGIVAIIIAISTKDVVAALTIAYDILVGGLLVAIIGGLVWKRGTGIAAAASMAVGSVITLGTMIILEINAKAPLDGIYANEPIYYGLIASAIVYVAVSLFSKPTDPAVMKAWTDRVAGTRVAEEELSSPAK